MSFGTWSTGVAWSTIKVPLAIAALRARSDSAELVFKTITQSDNAAAEELWSQLGDPAEAAQHVQAVIREAGDTATVVESRRLRSEYTPFGQTQWSLAHQAQFAAGLPHIPDAVPRRRSDAQPQQPTTLGTGCQRLCRKRRLGSGNRRRLFGPPVRDRPDRSGTVGVALAAETHDGEYEAGVDVVNTLADWVVDHLSELTQE